ncbi:type II toxin-antitoxin system RelE/ParE family toxin [Polaribacter litorisediminis]|uniref:type II toxin-antitoxin system RelE/ParE family toxin n=1 Tax=Polaribacter litorisediminis TaxID=1908341 RepID=UPI001CBE989A|nr:type II toxin-antitoxin system RelE/ParE family toxin [Polaribacter litorisediminis]UAM97863.1 type II toxin-antitoxin system RelE/ParE family toxin [Polaribacter litorisediminis]
MKSGYNILWSDNAIFELKETIEYLEKNWTEKELRKFSQKLDHTIELISKTPKIFPESYEKKEIRKAVIEKHNSLYYRIIKNSIEIVSLFSNLKNPDHKKL